MPVMAKQSINLNKNEYEWNILRDGSHIYCKNATVHCFTAQCEAMNCLSHSGQVADSSVLQYSTWSH